MALLLASVVPLVNAAGIGSSLGGDIGVEQFQPIVWQCGERVLVDDEIQPWRITDPAYCYEEYEGSPEAIADCLDSWRARLKERANNYIFEGETYQVDVLVFDKNKVEDNNVDLILGTDPQDDMGEYQVNCVLSEINFDACNARLGEEEFSYEDWDSNTMQGYTCSFTAGDSENMYGKYWITVKAENPNYPEKGIGTYDEISPMFFNPIMSLNINGGLFFDDVRPGTSSYSTVSVENNAEGGVLLDMFIAGKDWRSSDADQARCSNPVTGQLVNYLPLEAFRYYADKGAYSTRDDEENDNGYSSVVRDVDAEGYVNINRLLNDGFEEDMFDDAEIIQAGGPEWAFGPWSTGYRANVLNPTEEMGITFRLDLPEPCYGNFHSAQDGSIFIYGEAI